jgi:hypothetical protein
VVSIDELDKLSSSQQLIDAVNGLKDLFHIPGVHFVVSVSDEALTSFEQRSIPTRDAFDSAFDTIVSVERLQLKESLDIVYSRAAGFPPIVAMFCHAWSGGLPRDLLRTARRCVEVQRIQEQALPLVDIVRQVIVWDLAAYLEAAAHSMNPTCSAVTQLVEFRREILGLRNQQISASQVLAGIETVKPSEPTLDRARSILRVGLALLLYFDNLLKSQAEWENTTDQTAEVISSFAAAVRAQGDVSSLRDEAIEAAIRLSSLSV